MLTGTSSLRLAPIITHYAWLKLLLGQTPREVNKRYFSMPLPIEMDERRTQLKGWSSSNEKTRIYGLWRLLKKQVADKNWIRHHVRIQAELGVFGLRSIEILVLNDETTQGQSYRNQSEKVFLTINGQSQHTETANFLKTDCLLPDLAPYMIVHVDLSNAGYQANKIFQTARSGVIAIPEYEYFHERLVKALGDEVLRELDRQYKERKLKNAQPEDKELSRFIERVVKGNTSFLTYFQPGFDFKAEKPGGTKTKFVGNDTPTFIEITGENPKDIPQNRYGWVRIKTDAKDNYLTKQSSPGEFKWTSSKVVQISQHSLHDGIIPIRLDPVPAIQAGDKGNIEFILTRPGLEPLKAMLSLRITGPEKPKTNPSGTPPERKKSALKLPKPQYVPKEDWGSRIPPWTGSDIGEVTQSHDGITVYINKDPDVLSEFPKRNPRYASGDMLAAIQKKFFASIYLYAIAMFFEMGNNPEEKAKREWAIPMALKAVSKFILDLEFSGRSRRITDD